MKSSPRPLRWPLKLELAARDTREEEQRLCSQIVERALQLPGSRRLSSWYVAAAACFALVLGGFWFFSGEIGLGGKGSGPLLTESGESFDGLRSNGNRSKAIFSDGSWIETVDKSRLLALGSDARQMITLLEEGKATFDVVPGGTRQWVVEAGVLRVEVLGTRFTVERTADTVRVQVMRGSVLVRSSLLENGVVRLEAGRSLSIPPQQRTEQADAPPVHLNEISESSDEEREVRSDSIPATDSPGVPRSSSETVSVDELFSRADVARSRGDTSQAILELETLLRRFPKDGRAPAARFQLARLYLDLARFEEAKVALKVIAHGPGPLSEDGYLRWIELEKRQGHAEVVERLVSEYLNRYPAGRHKGLVLQLLHPQ